MAKAVEKKTPRPKAEVEAEIAVNAVVSAEDEASSASTRRVEPAKQEKKAKKTGVEVKVTLVDSVEKIVELAKEGVELKFDPESLPTLPQSALEELPKEAVESYRIAQKVSEYLKEKRREEEKAAVLSVTPPSDPLFSPYSKLKLRERKGWHQTWIRGDQFDEFVKEGQYRVVRRRGVDPVTKRELDEKPGEETGEVWKFKEDTDHDLIQVEVEEEKYQQYLKYVSYTSQRRYLDAETAMRSYIDEKNRSIPGRKERLLEAETDIEYQQEVVKTK